MIACHLTQFKDIPEELVPDKTKDMHTKRRKQLLNQLFRLTSHLMEVDFCFLFKEQEDFDNIESLKFFKLIRNQDDFQKLKVSAALKPNNADKVPDVESIKVLFK